MYTCRSFYSCVLLILIAALKGTAVPIPTNDKTNQGLTNRETVLKNTEQQLCVMSSLKTVEELHSLIKDLEGDNSATPREILDKENILQIFQMTKKDRALSKVKALLSNLLPGTGWTVIQQRIDGKENFNRTWTEYQNGFGSLDGDFFLGLEKIHSLTSALQHELYIHMVYENETIEYAHYDNFTVSNKEDYYKLYLANFTGNVKYDYLSNMTAKEDFYTFDNDTPTTNCASQNGGGFWYGGCRYV